MVRGKGTITETLNGKYYKTVNVEGFPRLYTLYSKSADSVGLLGLRSTNGVQAHDFTFGWSPHLKTTRPINEHQRSGRLLSRESTLHQTSTQGLCIKVGVRQYLVPSA